MVYLSIKINKIRVNLQARYALRRVSAHIFYIVNCLFNVM